MGLFSGITDAIFGTKSEAKSSQLPTMTPEQQKLLSQLIQQLGGEDLLQGGVTPYQGRLTTETSPLENMSLAALEQQAMNLVSPGSVNANAQGTVNDLMQSGGWDANTLEQFFKSNVADPSIKDFNEQILPGITRRFGGSGAFGSDRMLQESRAARDLGDTLTKARTNLAFQSKEAANNRRLQAAGLAPSVSGAPIQQLLQTLSAGGVPRGVDMSNIAAQYQEFVRQQQSKKDRTAAILAALGLKPFENQTVVTPGQPGLLQGFAQGAGAGVAKMFLG